VHLCSAECTMPLILYHRTENASESAALQGQAAKTPIIAGCVSGGCVALAWTIGFIIYFLKRRQHKREAIAAGYTGHKDFIFDKPLPTPATFIIPPDPAVTCLNAGPQIQERSRVEEREKKICVMDKACIEPEQMPPSPSSESSPPFSSMLGAPSTIDDSSASFLSARDSDFQFPALTRRTSDETFRRK